MKFVKSDMTIASLKHYSWIEVINPNIKIGKVTQALFDFDGTISVIRQGWEKIMTALMLEMICDGANPSDELIHEVMEYVDRSTGILTIKQMKWLEQAVVRHGLSKNPLSALEYKRIYNERLLKPVRERINKMGKGPEAEKSLMLEGVLPFVKRLKASGVTIYLASGTDHIYVAEEAAVVGVADLFTPHIYGAREDSEEDSKERIIKRIIEEYHLNGNEFLIVGDGPVEIQSAKENGAIALGVASDEINRHGINPRKRQRLIDAGADLLIGDFTHWEELCQIFVGEDNTKK